MIVNAPTRSRVEKQSNAMGMFSYDVIGQTNSDVIATGRKER